MDLADFLLARIAEDEKFAQSARRAQIPDGAEPWALDWGPGSDEDTSIEVTPARLLAECDAKRRIVELDEYAYDDNTYRYVLRLLALPYADHPDYDEEWRP